MKHYTYHAFCLALLLLVSFISAGQDPWMKGSIRFSEDSLYDGYFRIHSFEFNEIILLKQGKRHLAIPPGEVLAVEAVDGSEHKRWKVVEFYQKNSGPSVSLLLEEMYYGQKFILYKKDLSSVKLSPYAHILSEALEVDRFRHLVNDEVLILKDQEKDYMAVINKPHALSGSHHMINKNTLSDYLGMNKDELKDLVFTNDFRLSGIEGIISFLRYVEKERVGAVVISRN